MCILFCNQLRGWDGRNGRVGRESLFAIGTDGNLKKKKNNKKRRKKQNSVHPLQTFLCISGISDEPGK